MRLSKLVAQSIRMASREEAQAYVGGARILSLMEASGWVSACVRRNRLTLFDVKALDAACDRLAGGEFPESEQDDSTESRPQIV